MKLARTIRLDESDLNVFERPAELDEWAISGAFEFADWSEAHLKGKARQAFANGWLGLESFGRATFVAVTPITETELNALEERLAQHFVDRYGAPSVDAARPTAREEIGHMQEMCEGADDNALLVVSRELVSAGVKEEFRIIRPQEASLDMVAKHGD